MACKILKRGVHFDYCDFFKIREKETARLHFYESPCGIVKRGEVVQVDFNGDGKVLYNAEVQGVSGRAQTARVWIY